jgi:selenide, water dikinase
METIKLTQYAHGAGCGCKIAPQVLEQILSTQVSKPGNNVLVNFSNNDDAAVYDLGNESYLLSTTDFFTPIVDDPYNYGFIAAANAISDVYAMGGKPIFALAILGWPINDLPVDLAQLVMQGAQEACKQCGITIAGGHTIDVKEPIFGLSVNGMCSKATLKQNNTAQLDDVLFLTKPLGVGIYSAAIKRGLATENLTTELLATLKQINLLGEQLGKLNYVTALTDVTGFGLAGHLTEMCDGANLSAELYYNQLPLLTEVPRLATERIVPDATYRNWNEYGKNISFEKNVNVMQAFSVLPDPQTNGGLLVAVNALHQNEFKDFLIQHNYAAFTSPIGKFITRNEKTILVK